MGVPNGFDGTPEWAGVAGALQTFNDSNVGSVLGTTLHTLGAIVMLGALVGYLAWIRHLRGGQHQVNVLQISATLAYLAIILNLIGGFMRTYQSGHPHLDMWQESAWVQVMFVKHFFLFAGMGGLVWVFEKTAPYLLKAHKANKMDEVKWTGHRVGTSLAAVAILIASILGAVSQTVPLGMHVEEEEPEPAADPSRGYTFNGQLTTTLAAPTTQGGAFDVPEGASSLEVVLSEGLLSQGVNFYLVDPNDERIDGAGDPPRADFENPLAGTWNFVVFADNSVEAAWSLTVAVIGNQTILSDTVTVSPGLFFEINTEMEENATIAWNWTSSADLAFNVHTHFDGVTEYTYEVTTDHDMGNYTAKRSGGHSLMWENEGTMDVTLTYDARGQYTLHSIFA